MSLTEFEWDIFISYKRKCSIADWIHKRFVPCLRKELNNFDFQSELHRNPQIWIDEESVGEVDRWPARIASALGKSLILMPIYNHAYFGSNWCNAEYEAMAERQCPFLIPIQAHDGEYSQSEIVRRFGTFDALDFRDLAFDYGTVESNCGFQLQQKTRQVADRVFRIIQTKPDYSADYQKIAASKVDQTFAVTHLSRHQTKPIF